MKSSLGAHCDDFYASCRLNLKLNLDPDREILLQFFERIRRSHPSMTRFRKRHEGSFVLEDYEPDARETPAKRWIRLEPTMLRFGFFAPPAPPAWETFGSTIFEVAPYFLSLSDLDIDHLEVIYGFDLEYSGNHDQLVAETFYADHPLAGMLGNDAGSQIIDCQPCLGFTLTPNCDTQAYVEVKSRTTTYEVRTQDYETQLLSVYLTVRRYWGFGADIPLVDAFQAVTTAATELATQRVAPLVVNPLALAIASRP